MTTQILARAAVLATVLAVALAAGLLLRRGGRPRGVTDGQTLTPVDLGVPLGEHATLLQFSSAVCAPCRSTRRVLGELAGRLSGVAHVEVDAAQRLDLVRRLGVVRTPTVLVLDAGGSVRRRASGGLTPAQARAALAGLVPDVVATS